MRNHIHPRAMKLDEVVLGAMTPQIALVPPAPEPDDTQVDIELVEADYIDTDDWNATCRFSRPYERIEITPLRDLRPRIHELVTRPYPRTTPVELIEDIPEWRTTSWRWLAISLAAGVATVATMLFVG